MYDNFALLPDFVRQNQVVRYLGKTRPDATYKSEGRRTYPSDRT